MIEPAIWQSESMGSLTIRQRLMFIGMFSNADDQGRLRASAPVIRSMIFPYDDIALSEIETDLNEIKSKDFAIIYEVAGSRFAQIVNWWRYQKHQWAYPSSIPKPDGWTDRLRFRQGGKVITENWDGEKSFTQKPSIDQNRIEVGKGLGKGLGKDESKGKAKRTPKGEAAKPPIPPGVIAYRESAHKYPNKSLYEMIDQHVGCEPERVTFWANVVKSYISLGWNPANISGQLEWFDRNELPHKNGQTQHGNTTGRTKEPEYTPEELARAERINAARHAREAEMRKVQ